MDPQQYGQPPSGQPYGTPPTYQQPGYGQPPQGQPPYGTGYAPPAQGTANRWGPTSIGMDANIAAGLSYLIGILGIVFFFVEKTNRFLKFHCAQVILLAITSAALAIVEIVVLGLFGTAAAASDSSGLILLTGALNCVFGLAYLGILALWIWGMVSAFQGKYTKLPIIGNIAESMAGGAPVPVF